VELLGGVAVEAHALEEVGEDFGLGGRGVKAARGDLLAQQAAVGALLRACDDVGGLLLAEAGEELQVGRVGLERVGEGAVARGALLDVDPVAGGGVVVVGEGERRVVGCGVESGGRWSGWSIKWREGADTLSLNLRSRL
jgi:hypothetical protein